LTDYLFVSFNSFVGLIELKFKNNIVVMIQQTVPFLYLAAGIWLAAFLGDVYNTVNELVPFNIL
jgi:hypothetical protein